MRFTVAWLANGTRLCTGATRHALHRLFDKGALRLVECAKSGHVVPRTKLGRNSYRNLVSCCYDCNMKKKDRPAEGFLRWLYRERRLDKAELSGRLRALDDLAAGKLKPLLPGQETVDGK